MSLEILDYLKQENQQLQEQVRELQGLLQLNKQALKVLMPTTNDEQHKGLLTVMKNLQEENETLQITIEKLVKERNEAQSDQLINQQITEQVQRQEKELIASLQQKMQGMQENLRFAENKLAKMEELKPEYDEVAGVVIKFKEVCNPDLICLKMHNEIQMLNEQLLIEQKQKQKLIKEKSNIQGLNLRLMNELLQQRSVAHAGNKLIFMNQDPDQLVEFQTRALKLINNSSSSQSHSSQESEPPLDSSNSLKRQQQCQMNPKKGTVIPKLNLTIPKQIQEINAKRLITQSQKPLNDIQSMEKIQKLENALDELRKNHQREMILNKTLQAHNDELQRCCDEMEHRIKLLTNSNLRYQERAKKMSVNYKFLHQFYLNNKDLMPTTSLSSNQYRQTSTHQIEEEQSQSKQFDIDEMESPIQKQNNDTLIQQQQTSNVYYYMPNSKEQSIKYLLQTAQQIYSTIYERVDRVIQEEPECKHRFRSFSEIILN
ncbi:unnamed protein product [Paramecium octaurelia]|uniref:Uncharacterized protein n=1 Tax=Paramecium octaurelia TaxID=43137 RepID=A0A8S1W1P5_PAROT|nr:unnamed protein product [Paramecium octaurelia]